MANKIFESEIKRDDDNKKYYIWHCPSLDCKAKGIVLFKTTAPYIGEGKVKCHNCEKVYDFKIIQKENKRNILKYIESVDN